MPLILAGQTEGWKLHLQLTDGSFIRAAPTDTVILAGTTAGQPINPSNNSTHLYAGVMHLCSSIHGHNTKRLTDSTVSIDGAISSSLPVATSNCSLLLSFFSLEEIQTSNARIWSFNGTTEATPINGVNVYLAEGGTSSLWILSNGSGNPLLLSDRTIANIEQNFYIAISTEISGGGSGQTLGALKISLSYI